MQKAQDQEDGRQEQSTGQGHPHSVQAVGTVEDQVGSQGKGYDPIRHQDQEGGDAFILHAPKETHTEGLQAVHQLESRRDQEQGRSGAKDHRIAHIKSREFPVPTHKNQGAEAHQGQGHSHGDPTNATGQPQIAQAPGVPNANGCR